MRSLLLLFVSIGFLSLSYAQTPIDVVFKKYSDKDGVDISIDKIPMKNDSVIKAPLSTISKTLTFSNDESDKKIAKLFQQILLDCNKILSRKEYVLISNEKDDDATHKVFKKEKGAVAEICELEYDADELTLTVTQISGLTKEMQKNFVIKTDIKTITSE
jgi:hypothetical protein